MITKNLILMLLLTLSLGIYGQVTIGSLVKPEKGALLDLKTQEADNPNSVTAANNITSVDGGLALPRVMLVNRTTLEPFVATTDLLWTATNSKIREKHAGLMVYNIHVSPDTETDPNKIFRQGAYVWDGTQWTLAYQGRTFFPCPAFNLPLPRISQTDDEDFTFDLYAEYETQFMASINSLFVSNNSSIQEVAPANLNRLYKAIELDYVVTYYDESVLTITGIDAMGVMSYRVLNHDPSVTSFINIIFVIKE